MAPTDDEVEAFVDLLEKNRNVRGVVLQIPVHGDQDGATRMLDAGRHSGGLTIVPAELDETKVHIVLITRQNLGDLEGSIPAAVVDEDDLDPSAEVRDCRAYRVIHRSDIRLLVIERNDDGEGERHGCDCALC